MPAQSDRLLLTAAFAQLDADAFAAAPDIIGRGQIRVIAMRNDIPNSTTPERVEELLARATRAEVIGDTITAHYEPGPDIKSILGPRSNMQNENVVAWHYRGAACTVIFRDACVYRSELLQALEEAGYAVRRARSRREGTGPKQRNRRARQPRRGPKPGETGFNAADRALFPAIKKIQQTGKARSAIAAARILDEKGLVAGDGSPESRAVRLARRFGKWKSTTQRKA